MSNRSSIETAFALHRSGALVEAERSYRALLDAEPDNLNCLQLLGALVSGTGRTTEAVELLERAVAVLRRTGAEAAQHAALYNNLGNALKAVGRVPEALEAYRHGVELDPSMAELNANLGAALLAQGSYAEASASYEASLRAEPGSVDHWCSLAGAYGAMGRHDAAVEAFSRALALRPGHWLALNGLGESLTALGRFDEALAAVRSAVAVDPRSLVSRRNLARVLLLAGQHEAAAALFLQLAAERPDDGWVHLGLANAQRAMNQLDAALASAMRAAAMLPDEAAAHLLVARIQHTRKARADAESRYRSALRLEPHLAEAWLHFGVLMLEMGRPDEALEACRQLLAIEPDNADGCCAMGVALAKTGNQEAAIEAFRRCLRIRPDFVTALYQLGVLLVRQGASVEAVLHLQRTVALQGDHADAHAALGDALQQLGHAELAREAYLRSQQLRPIRTTPAAKGTADFSILVLIAPGTANTPYSYLLGHGAYDSHYLGLVPGLNLDLDALRVDADVVVNLISDVDQGHDMLSIAATVVDHFDRPTVNHPRRILATDRETAAGLLAGIPFCHVPRTVRYSAEELRSPDVAARLESFSFPLLLRKAGTHGGDALDRIEDPGEIGGFLDRHPSTHYYVTQFVDYGSNDGRFRKYRFIFTDNQIFPYHLAIASEWKVHHYRTEMDTRIWMQNEEEAFLADPARAFDKRHYAGLRAIQQRMALEFFGIDCSIDREGNLLVFEVNASMLIHDDNADFPYKAPHVARIKTAFDVMLAKMAVSGRSISTALGPVRRDRR